MLLQTKHFGEIDVNKELIISFKDGIPGYENLKKYIIIDSLEVDSPFKWMQCIDNPELAFALVNPFIIKKDYDFELNEEIIGKLGIDKEEDVAVYSIVVVPEDINKLSMNLKAPIIINSVNKKGAQIILDTDRYTVRHYILEELRRQEDGSNVSVNEEKRPDNCFK